MLLQNLVTCWGEKHFKLRPQNKILQLVSPQELRQVPQCFFVWELPRGKWPVCLKSCFIISIVFLPYCFEILFNFKMLLYIVKMTFICTL